jgi:hypothetical protein
MVAAATALALLVTVSTLYIDHYNGRPEPGKAVTADSSVTPQSGGAELASEIKAPEVEPEVPTPIRSTSRSGRFMPPSFPPAVPAIAASPNEIAGVDGSTSIYIPKTKRMLKYRSRFYGAETASVSEPKPVNAALTF